MKKKIRKYDMKIKTSKENIIFCIIKSGNIAIFIEYYRKLC